MNWNRVRKSTCLHLIG